MIFVKKVNNNECMILKELFECKSTICPKIISIDNDEKIVVFEKYDCTLSDFIYKINGSKNINCEKKNLILNNTKSKLKYLIKKLHLDHMIIHGDLHPNNIVVNISNLNKLDNSDNSFDLNNSDNSDNLFDLIDIRIIDFGIASKFSDIDLKKIRIYNSLYAPTNPFKNLTSLINYETSCVDMIFEIF